MADIDIFPAFDRPMMDRWNREWLTYLATESMSPHLAHHSELEVVEDLAGRSPAEVYATVFTRCDRFEADVALAIWCAGDDLIDRDVVEIGCGCGVLGKQFGTVARSYLGLDYSELALAIARGASPSNCTYGMPSDRKLLEPLAHSCDTLVGREFFIHQNLDQARRVLRIARHLIRPGGIICADFYHTNPDIPQGAVHPADSPLDPQYASAGFHYEPADTQLLADEFGLTIRSQDRDFERQRLFTIFEVGA